MGGEENGTIDRFGRGGLQAEGRTLQNTLNRNPSQNGVVVWQTLPGLLGLKRHGGVMPPSLAIPSIPPQILEPPLPQQALTDAATALTYKKRIDYLNQKNHI